VSNHLAFLIFHYALLFARPDQSAVFHPRRIAIGGLLMRNGEKISKGKGNGIPLIQVREKFGADLYRLYIATGTTFDAEFDFRDRDVPALRVRYETWKKLMFAAKAAAPKAEAELGSIDRWLLSKFYSRAAEYWPAMEAMRFRDAFVSILFEFLKDISYHTRRTSAANTAAVMRIIFVDYVLLMTPAVPHICEEMYVGEAADDRFVSLAAFDRTRPLHQRIDKCAEAIEAIPLELRRALGKELDNIQKQPKLGTEPGVLRIEIVQACDRMFELFGVLSATLGTTRKAKEVMEAARRAVPDADWAGCISKLVPRTLSFGLQPYLEKEAEKSFLLESAVTFLRAEYPDAVISVTDADTVVDKWRVALPGSPAVVVRR